MKLGNRKLSDMIAPGQDVTAWAEEIEDLESQRDRLAEALRSALYGKLDQINALNLLAETSPYGTVMPDMLPLLKLRARKQGKP